MYTTYSVVIPDLRRRVRVGERILHPGILVYHTPICDAEPTKQIDQVDHLHDIGEDLRRVVCGRASAHHPIIDGSAVWWTDPYYLYSGTR